MKKVKRELRSMQYCLYRAAPHYKSLSKEHYYKNQKIISDYLRKVKEPE